MSQILDKELCNKANFLHYLIMTSPISWHHQSSFLKKENKWL